VSKLEQYKKVDRQWKPRALEGTTDLGQTIGPNLSSIRLVQLG
jgi:hypothetical protein